MWWPLTLTYIFKVSLFWLGIQHNSIVWVIMRRRGVSSEHRCSSCSSCTCWWPGTTRASAGTVMTEVRCCIDMGPAQEINHGIYIYENFLYSPYAVFTTQLHNTMAAWNPNPGISKLSVNQVPYTYHHTQYNQNMPCLYMYSMGSRYNDVMIWKHIPCYWPFVRGIHQSWWIPLTKCQ